MFEDLWCGREFALIKSLFIEANDRVKVRNELLDEM
jgi:hypothetical protein